MEISKKIAALQDLDRKYHLHPFTNHSEMHESGTHVILSGDGCYLVDENQRKLLDALAGLWCVNVGYNCTELIDAITSQLKDLAFYPSFFNSTTEATILLSEKLAELAPEGVNHAIFCNSGSEANETALKVIRGYFKLKNNPQKFKIISRTFSYHGVGIASGSLTGLTNCTDPFGLPLDGFLRVPGPYAYGAEKEDDSEGYENWCLEQTEELIKQEGSETIAAMFVEPIQGAGGVIIPSENYLQQLRDICRRNDILFVADEVITGFGRLGAWFASNMWNLQPDIITMAKGISSGYIPLGATMVNDEIAAVLSSGGYFAHGFTYSGHPVACAAGLANIRIHEKEQLPERVKNDIGPYFENAMRQFADHPAVGEVRVKGLLGAIELVPAAGRSHVKPEDMLGARAVAYAREEGLIVRGIRNLIALAPPLIITRAQVDEITNVLDKIFDRLHQAV